jgi:hypothetical protein
MIRAFFFDSDPDSRRHFDPDADDLPDGCSEAYELPEAKNVIVFNPGPNALYYRRSIRLGASSFTYHRIEPYIIETPIDEVLE